MGTPEDRMKIYTGSGDRGKTSLFSGERVSKGHERVDAYGELDELNSVIGALIASLPPDDGGLREELEAVQSRLFPIGAWLATSPGAPAAAALPPLDPADAVRLERCIDRLDAGLPALTGFILPGGHAGAAWAHIARTICRRTERRVVRLVADVTEVGAAEQMRPALVYLNRLSDYFFTLARHINRTAGIADRLWRR
jgi:cob(I)alamin adenosyltransferase